MDLRYEQPPGTFCGMPKPQFAARMPLWRRAIVLLGGIVFLPVLLMVLGFCILLAKGLSSQKHKFTEIKEKV